MITGLANEKQIINYVNRKKYNEFNDNIKNFLDFIFYNEINLDKQFFAEDCGGNMKPDIKISHNGISKYISIKKGSGNSVHQEPISTFFPFFKNCFGETYLNKLKLFHYADDTTDDSGETRYSASEAKKRYKDEVSQLNLKFNDEHVLKSFLDRFLFCGNVSTKCVDFIYHGSLEIGYWASRPEITNYFTNNNFLVNGLHFGPLTYQVWGRNNNSQAKHPNRRYVMQIKWGSLLKDLINIRNGVKDVV